jgi:hypothetical protein
MIEKLIPEISNSDSFIKQYQSLVEQNVGVQFIQEMKLNPFQNFDIKYLLKCADVLSFSNNTSDLDKALRICQAAITNPTISNFYREKASFILQKLGNYPLISLAKSKGFLKVVFRNLCHFSNIKKTGMTHDSIFRLQQSIS